MTSNDVKKTNEISVGQTIKWGLNTIYHQSLAVVSVYIVWTVFYNSDISSASAWHYGLTTLAYVPIMAEGLVLFSSDNVWTRDLQRPTKGIIHAVILLLSAILATVGISLEVNHKSENGSSHFVSTHAWTGLVSWVLVLVSQILGILAFYAQRIKIVRPVYLKFIHNLLGIVGFEFGMVSLLYALDLHFMGVYTTSTARHSVYWSLVIFCCTTVIEALKSLYQQVVTIFSN